MEKQAVKEEMGEGTRCSYGNYSFNWTRHHLPREETDPLRYQYDELGSEVVDKLQEIAKKAKEEASDSGKCPARTDLYALLRDHRTEDATLAKFWDEVHTVPDWVDWAQLERGQRFFYRYAAANIMGFAFQGFVGENSAASGVVEVLVRTGGFSTRVLLRRLLETFQMILQVTESIEAVKPGGTGHTTTIRVRLLHSSVRNRIMKLAKKSPEYFDVDKFGVPVNTLDSIHSIATFCCNHMWLQLPQMGVYTGQQEMADYIALWRYVGYVLATPDSYFATVEKAKATMESMVVHELHITPTSRIVGHNFVECLKDLPPFNVSAQFIEAGSRVLNGDELCDALDMGRPGLYSYACFRGHCWLVRTLALLQWISPSIDAAVTGWFQKMLHQAIIHSKGGLCGGSKLDFKYVPQMGQTTGKEDNDRGALKLSPFRRPVESVYFGIFLIGCVSIAGVSWGLFCLLSLIWNVSLGDRGTLLL